jgi:hypothetical protein
VRETPNEVCVILETTNPLPWWEEGIYTLT